MRGALVAAALLMMTVSGCLGEEPETQSVDDGDGGSCTVSVNATSASASCTSTSSTNSTTTAPSSNATGNQTTPAGNSTAGGNATVGGNATGNATGNETAGPAPIQQFTCTVDVPAVVVSISGLPMAVGECEFTTTDVPTLLMTAEPASGCTIRLDENPNDTSSGGVVSQGSTNPAGVYTMRCDIQGPSTGGEGRIEIQAEA